MLGATGVVPARAHAISGVMYGAHMLQPGEQGFGEQTRSCGQDSALRLINLVSCRLLAPVQAERCNAWSPVQAAA